MKYLFISILILLNLGGLVLYLTEPETQTDADALIYWTTDPNPIRDEQLAAFEAWKARHPELPDVEVRVDTANRNPQKTIIQGVSGTLSDVFDASPDWLTFFHTLGITADITEMALEEGFDPSTSFEVAAQDVVIDGRQYAYPCSMTTYMLFINKDTFARYGQPLPPPTWDFETFERMGKAFVDAANPPGEPRRTFYLDAIDMIVLRRSVGVSLYNETMTACGLNNERYTYALRTLLKWMYEDHIIPSAVDVASFSTEAGYGGSRMQLFNNGNYGMFHLGRFALIQLRKFGALNLDVTYHPCDEFLNAFRNSRVMVMYEGSENKDYARYFLKFLTSREYNMQIVRSADALPPNPKYLETEEFLRPPEHPNEWGLHEKFARALQEAGIGYSLSPFLVPMNARRLVREVEDAVIARRDPPEAAGPEAERIINDGIERYLVEHPNRRPLYEELTERQKKIDALRARGEKVPLSWITNPFHRKYYLAKGWADPDS